MTRCKRCGEGYEVAGEDNGLCVTCHVGALEDNTFPVELTREFRGDIGRIVAAALGAPSKAKLQTLLELAIHSLIASGIHPDDVHMYCAERCANAYVEQALGATSAIDGTQLSEEERHARLMALLLQRAGGQQS